MMNRYETIDSIRELNPSASSEFLAQFPTEELTAYLERLTVPEVLLGGAVGCCGG